MSAEFQTVSIVLLGRFNPSKFSPAALAEAKIIAKQAANAAVYKVLLPGAQVQFDFGWGELLVTGDRFQILTSQAPFVRICDFVLKSISDLAPDSEVTSFGINREGHYKLADSDARNALGIKLAPPDAWGNWGARVLETIKGPKNGTKLQGGLWLMQMRLPFENGQLDGFRDVVVQPSNRVSDNRGIHVQTNHHHQLITDGSAENVEDVAVPSGVNEPTSKLLDRLPTVFDDSVVEAEAIFEGIVAQ